MNRRTALLAGALALAVLACAGFLLWQSGHAQAAVTAQIYQYGELVEEVRLDPTPFLSAARTGRRT